MNRCGATERPRRLVALLLALVVSAAALPAAAQSEEDDLDYGNVYAIQPRPFRMNHEFSLSVGFMPLDAFYKFFAVGGHYVLHLDDFWAWEALHFSMSRYLDIDTGLKKQLNEDWDASATDTPRLHYVLDSSLMLKPLYGKVALLDKYVVYGETYILIGVGAQKFETAWFPALNFGLGLRVFITGTVSMRLEVREYVWFEETGDQGGGGAHSTLYFGLGFSYNGFAEDLQAEAAGVSE